MRRSKVSLILGLLLFVGATQPLDAQRRRAVRPPASPETAEEWIRAAAVPFDTAEPETGFDDLRPLRHIVGDARLVSLGEGTHGTHEFFAMKHRIFEYLVEEMGFTIFIIEANLPEADIVDDYVMKGEGWPEAALSGLYFWTWNTEEVLDLIEWMRAYNLRRGDRPPVRFRGNDAQYADVAIREVRAYVNRVDPSAASSFRPLYDCIFRRDYQAYRGLPTSWRNECRGNVRAARDQIAARRSSYIPASSADEYERLLRYAEVVVQVEGIWSSVQGRDHSMALNTEWLLETLHPGEKGVVWAHNKHVTAQDWWRMGSYLRQYYGDEQVIVGFSFDRGSFNAYGGGGLREHEIQSPPSGGYEDFLSLVDHPRFILDMRRPNDPARTILEGPNSIWSVGSVFNGNENEYRWWLNLNSAFDVLIHFRDTTPSRLRWR